MTASTPTDPARVVLLLTATRGFDRGVLSGISRYASLHGPWSFYREQHAYYLPRAKTTLSELRQWRPTGVVCPISRLDLVEPLGVPVVGLDLNDYAGPVPGILSDDRAMGRVAAEHLLAIGLRRFGFCGLPAMRWSAERSKGFSETIEAAGFSVEEYQPDRKTKTSWVREEPHVREWIQSLPKPIGVFCPNDDRSAYILETCRALGYAVPEDVAVIGVDDDPYVCELSNPTLTSVSAAADQAGYRIAELLDQMMRGEATAQGQRIVARAAGVTTRQSTDTLMVRDVRLRKALTYIRENASRAIQVRDVVRASTLSHRALNELFKQEFGASILQHVTVARSQHICRLLRETELPIHRVAEMVGFESSQHFSRYFRRSAGMTPKEYREQHATP